MSPISFILTHLHFALNFFLSLAILSWNAMNMRGLTNVNGRIASNWKMLRNYFISDANQDFNMRGSAGIRAGMNPAKGGTSQVGSSQNLIQTKIKGQFVHFQPLSRIGKAILWNWMMFKSLQSWLLYMRLNWGDSPPILSLLCLSKWGLWTFLKMSDSLKLEHKWSLIHFSNNACGQNKHN